MSVNSGEMKVTFNFRCTHTVSCMQNMKTQAELIAEPDHIGEQPMNSAQYIYIYICTCTQCVVLYSCISIPRHQRLQSLKFDSSDLYDNLLCMTT